MALRRESFPADPDFPQLEIASDPRRMLEVFRTNLKPVTGQACFIEACTPVRFRCRQSGARCVLQYSVRVVDGGSGRRWDQWVTGVVYARRGEAERLWRELEADDSCRDIPEPWRSFEPVDFIPDLGMLVQVFPFDRRLPNLLHVLGGGSRRPGPPLWAGLGPDPWSASGHALEPIRYRSELGAILKHARQSRGVRDAERPRHYLKVYRNDRGRNTFEVLQQLAARERDRWTGYSVVRPIAYVAELRTLALEEAPGVTLQRLLGDGRDHTATVHLVARAVASFNRDTLPLAWSHSRAEQLADVERASRLVAWARPDLRAEVEAITNAMAAGLHDVAPTPIHGDLKPDHIFLAGERVTFIDLDSAALGDPVRDPAHLFAHLVARVGLDSISLEQALAAAAAFAEEYLRHVPRAWRQRFPLHCAGALLEVAGGIFKRQEPEWPARVAVAIAQARTALSGAIP